MNEIAQVWFEEARKLEVGQTLFLRVGNKKEQLALAIELERERAAYAVIDPVHASQLFINKVLKDLKQYVTVERKYRAVFTAFLRKEDGEFTKLAVDPERARILKLMIKDKKSREEIEDTLNGLTDEERAEYFS